MPRRVPRPARALALALGAVSWLIGTWPVRAEEPVARLPHEAVDNWGRWGADDERGTANYITPEAIVAAARLIRNGRTFSLAIPLDAEGPVFPGRLAPHHTMVVTGADYEVGAKGPMALGDVTFADDYIYMPLQGSTQWDALSHSWYGGRLYNGVPQSAIRSAPAAGGATKLGIENVKDSLVGRGVLVDLVAAKGAPLPPGYAITVEDVKEALKRQKTEVHEGDIVLFRTGWVPGFYREQGALARLEYVSAPQAGILPEVVSWAHERHVAAMAADNLALEVIPHPKGMEASFGVHGNMLRDLGMYIGEIWWLEELAADCEKDQRYEFFLAAQPLNVTGAVGSPLNPVAIK